MDRTTGCDSATGSQSLKSILSSDCALKPERMKMDLLVIADQHAAVNTFSGLVHTARQVGKVGGSRSTRLTRPKLNSAINAKS